MTRPFNPPRSMQPASYRPALLFGSENTLCSPCSLSIWESAVDGSGGGSVPGLSGPPPSFESRPVPCERRKSTRVRYPCRRAPENDISLDRCGIRGQRRDHLVHVDLSVCTVCPRLSL